jgi:hypothetical protein
MRTKKIAFALTVLSTLAWSPSVQAQAFGGPVGGPVMGGWGYGWGFVGAGSTAAGSALLGGAALTAAAGEAEFMDSMAQKNYQDAYEHWVENQKLREATYYDMRRAYASYRAESHIAAPTPEQSLALSRSRLPRRMSEEQLDPHGGQIKWPEILLRDEFASDRAAVERLFAERTARPYDAGRGTRNFREVRQVTDGMHDRLRSLLSAITPDEFIVGNKFLNSLAYEARFVPDSTVAVK